jgi:hypothetical protein
LAGSNVLINNELTGQPAKLPLLYGPETWVTGVRRHG